MSENNVSEAEIAATRKLVWDLYCQRINEIVEGQFKTWKSGHPSINLIAYVPSNEVLGLVSHALRAARDEGLHQALMPIIRAIDAIDNSGKKSVDTKRHYDRLDQIAKDIRAMKSTDFAVAK